AFEMVTGTLVTAPAARLDVGVALYVATSAAAEPDGGGATVASAAEPNTNPSARIAAATLRTREVKASRLRDAACRGRTIAARRQRRRWQGARRPGVE